MKTTRARFGRLVVVIMLVLPVVAALPTVSSADTEAELATAKQRVEQLGHDMEVLNEEANAAQIRLDEVRTQLAEVEDIKADADADQATAIEQLAERAHSAYMESGSQLEALLGSGDFADFSDRLEFLGQLQQQDSDLAAIAENASQRADWAAEELAKTEAQHEELVAQIADKKAQFEQLLSQQEELVDKLGDQLQAEQAAARRAAQQAAAEQAATSGSGTGTSDAGGSPPPINGSGAEAAVAAAYSVLGTPYVWGGASPSGFDCSGLTMWSWAHGGVSLPHNSAAQYAATPRVDRSQLQPGDLVFFYSPISHVSLYIGGGRMIDASHPGPGGQVKVDAVGSGYVGGGRPG